MSPLRTALPLLLAAAFVLTLPFHQMGDDVVRFDDLERVLKNERTAQKFSMVGPLFATPLYYLGREFGSARDAVWWFNRLLLLAGCAGFWWLLRPLLGTGERVRFVVALLATSMIPYHLMYFGGEVFSSLALAFGLGAAVLRRAWWGVPLAVLGVVNTPGMIGGLTLGVVALVARYRRLRHLLAVPVAAGLYLLENYLRRDDPFFTGYDGEHGAVTFLPYSGRPEFGHPLFFGVLALLFSFGKGLIYFVPALFLPPPRDPERPADAEADLRWLFGIWVAILIGLLLVYSRWWAWYGGWFWGPRFLLLACFPAALAVARRTTPASAARLGTPANLLTLAALALACWAAVGGVVFQQRGLERYAIDGFVWEFIVWYVPECSALWWPFTERQPLTPADVLRLSCGAVAFAYLAAPVLAELWRRVPGWLAAARGGPRIRF